MKDKIANGLIATLAFIGAVHVIIDILTIFHLMNCPTYRAHAEWARTNGCDNFWCPHYNGK